MKTIDLRSDTVTQPTPAMREAMARAQVGDDCYGDDPTVNQLEADAARLLGKEAAVFVASGTQGNLCALLAHCQRGDAVILGDSSHIFRYEQGGIAQLGGILPHTVPVQSDGSLHLQDLEAAVYPDDEHMARTRMVTLENTHNAAGGQALSAAYTDEVGAFCRRHNLRLHIDGARIFNAAAAQQVDVQALVAAADSVTFCLSKGLCAPAGSVLAGSKAFIQRARRARKVLGGGMRQAGVLAAAGLLALHDMRLRLADDHANAQLLAEGISEIPSLTVQSQYTNFVQFSLTENSPLSPESLSQRLAHEHNILLLAYGGPRGQIRLRTHYWIDQAAIERFLAALRACLI